MEVCNSIQFLNQSVFVETVLRYGTVSLDDVLSHWSLLSEHQQQFPRLYAYQFIGSVVLNKNT